VTRARVIVNPSSGRERAPDAIDSITATLRRRFSSVEITETLAGGDAERAAVTAVADGCDVLFVAGGDGTVNEVMNGLAAARVLDRVAIGILPFGTGNDFATALGIPSDIDAALEVLVRAEERRTDLGEVNGRVFINTSGGGFIAEVSEAVTPQLKTIAGRLAYLIGGAQALIEFEPVRARIRMEPGHRERELGVHAFAICNSRLIGGGRLIAPDAVVDDGRLDVCLIEAMGMLEFAALARKVADGEHVGDPRVIYEQVESARIELDRTIKVNTDGEVFEDRLCNYRVLPKAARFLVGDEPLALGRGQTGGWERNEQGG
jgi:diacylglycerol kinase (ATP)